GRMSGTSMATPMVTGAAALLLASNKKLTAAQLKSRLINGSDETVALNNRTVSDGQINVANAIANKAGVDVPETAGSTGSGTTNPRFPHWPRPFYAGPLSIDDLLATA